MRKGLYCINTHKNIFALFLLTFVSFLLFNCLEGHASTSKKVLILHSYHQGNTWTDRIESGIESVLEYSAHDVQVFTEYMDTKRHIRSRLFPELLKLYKAKYYKSHFDVIIVSDNNAFDFILANKETLFPEVPVVFCGINNFSKSMLQGQNNVKGVVEDISISETIDTITTLLPSIDNIAIINDQTPTGIAMSSKLQQVLPSINKEISITVISNVSEKELLTSLSALKKNTALLIFSFFRDREGRQYSQEDYISLIVNNTNLPAFSLWEQFIGRGIAGGVVTSGFEQGRTAGMITDSILKGESASIPSTYESPNIPMFDYNQLVKLGIPLFELPGKSLVINKPVSFYYKYRNLAWSAILVFSFLGFVIAVLSKNISTRKRAEEELRRNTDELEEIVKARTRELVDANLDLQKEFEERKLIESARKESEEKYAAIVEMGNDGVVIVQEGKISFTNYVFSQMVDKTHDELKNMPVLEVISPEYRELVKERYQQRMAGEDVPSTYETELVSSEGHIIPVELNISILVYEGNPATMAVVRNISERKKTEEILQKELKLRYILLDNLPCLALILKKHSREIVACNEVARSYGAETGKTCFSTCAKASSHCKFCLASEVWETGEPRKTIAQHDGKWYEGYWVPFTDELYIHYIFDITSRKNAEDKIKSSLEEKELLLQEIHHRVKNNMTVIHSLLTLQSKYIKDEAYSNILNDSISRIKSMALVHEKLYQSKDLARIDFNSYFESMVDNIFASHRSKSHLVTLTTDIKGISLGIDAAIPCGLIINELISNAYKHAFPLQRSGEITVALHTTDDNNIELSIRDNGIGMPENFILSKADTLGLNLVNSLVKQLRGEISLHSGKGTDFRISFRRRD